MTNSTYSTTDDLLTGDVPLPGYLNAQKFVNDAADEVDSKIGFIYQTPVDVADSSNVARPARLLLKRLANFLASGRLLLAVDVGGEDKQVHAYGLMLVTQACEALDEIAAGNVILQGAPKLPGQEKTVLGPVLGNKDNESLVDAFYDRIANPAYCPPLHYIYPSRLPTPTPLVYGGPQ